MPDGNMMMRSKSLAGSVKALGDRQVRVIVSTPSEDREGDIIEVNGIDLTNYQRNPVVLFNHNMNCPIARCVSLQKVNGHLEAVAEFPAEGLNDESDKVYNLIKSGIINAASIGFIPVEWTFIDDNSWARRFAKCEMIEFSFVSVPANAEALIIQRGLNDDEDDMNVRTLKDLCKSSTSPMAMSVALQAAAIGAAMVEGSRGEPKSNKQLDNEAKGKKPDEEMQIDANKSPDMMDGPYDHQPNMTEDHEDCPMPHGSKSDDNDEDDKPGAVEDPNDNDEDDQKGCGPKKPEEKDDGKSLSEVSVQKTVTTNSPNPDVVEKTADESVPNGGEPAPVETAAIQSKSFSRQKALRELELLKLRTVV